jgi:hypothetical protein
LVANAASLHAADPWADTVVSFTQGTGANTNYANPQAALGAPTSSATLTSGAYLNTDVVSLGLGGTLVVGFNAPIYDSPDHPFGADFLIFGNSFFTLSGGTISGAFTEPAQTIWVSQDNASWFQLSTTRGADNLFPTNGTGNATLPVDPSLTLADFKGKSTSDALVLYQGSAGGTPFDLAWAVDAQNNPVALPWISYVKIVNTSSSVTGEIDAVAAVSPVTAVPEPSEIAQAALGAITLATLRRKRHKL